MKTIILAALFFYVTATFAQNSYNDYALESNKAAGIVSTTQNSTAAKEASAAKDTGTNINQNAETGEKSQKSGSATNMMAAAMLMAACMATQPPNMALCAMGALAAMQGAHDAGAAKKSNDTYKQSLYNDGNATTGSGPSASDDTGAAGFPADVAKGLDKMKADGYSVSEAGITFPDGSFKPASAFSSPAAMAAAGLNPEDGQKAAEILKGLNTGTEDPNAIRISSIATDGGPGGGGGGNRANSDDSNGFSFSNPWALSKAARQKMVEGKSVNVAGEPIGVKGDHLFEMVHRAYGKRRETANFIENEYGVASASTRAPASAAKGK